MDEFQRREYFHKAADILERDGWIRGAMQRHGSRGRMSYCAVGALRQAADELGLPRETSYQLPRGTGIRQPQALIYWNDTKANAEDVVSRFRAMAAGKMTITEWKRWKRERNA